MPTVPNITALVQYFAGCSSQQAERAAWRICQDADATDLLVKTAMKCGVASAGVGLGWLVASGGITPVTAPLIGAGVGIAGYSGLKAKEFCGEIIEHWDRPVSSDLKQLLR